MPTLEELVGARLVIGIPGTKITSEIIYHFQELHAGGLILYRINFERPSQLKKLISDLENALERKLLVVTDHEGGRVIMFREGVTIFPDNLACGMTGKIEYAKKQGEIEAKELRRLGIDVSLGPCLDVLTQSYSPNIGIRSYGTDWKLVSAMSSARISAMQKGGLSACAKHFPGKGHAPVDAHLGLPVIKSTWKEMEEVHLKPFQKAIESGVHLIMSSHPYYPNLDPKPNRIATFSRKIIYDYLRLQLGFKGVISSDDLEMGAIKEICSIETAAIRATKAGHDILLVCHNLDAQKKVFYALLEAYKNKELNKKELEESVERIEKLKAIRYKRFEGGKARPEVNGGKLAEKICLESVRFLSPQSSPFQLSPQPHSHLTPFLSKESPDKSGSLTRRRQDEDSILVIFPKLSSLAHKIMIEKEVLNEEKFIQREFRKYKIMTRVFVVSIEPTDSEIQEAIRESQKSDFTIFFCYDAHLYPSNKKLLDELQSQSKNLTVVLLRDPYDIEFIDEKVTCITDFGWRVCQIKAVIKKIVGKNNIHSLSP